MDTEITKENENTDFKNENLFSCLFLVFNFFFYLFSANFCFSLISQNYNYED